MWDHFRSYSAWGSCQGLPWEHVTAVVNLSSPKSFLTMVLSCENYDLTQPQILFQFEKMSISLIQCHSELPKRLYNVARGTKHKLLVHNQKKWVSNRGGNMVIVGRTFPSTSAWHGRYLIGKLQNIPPPWYKTGLQYHKSEIYAEVAIEHDFT